MSWQYILERNKATRTSAIFRSDEHCIQRMYWTMKGTFVWKTISRKVKI